jgi:hypothetical protein
MPYEIPRKFVDIVLRINHYKFADLQFADWYTTEMIECTPEIAHCHSVGPTISSSYFFCFI